MTATTSHSSKASTFQVDGPQLSKSSLIVSLKIPVSKNDFTKQSGRTHRIAGQCPGRKERKDGNNILLGPSSSHCNLKSV